MLIRVQNPTQARGLRSNRTYQTLNAGSTFEGLMRLIDWYRSRRTVTAHDLMNYMGCSRATAYRRLAALKAASGRC